MLRQSPFSNKPSESTYYYVCNMYIIHVVLCTSFRGRLANLHMDLPSCHHKLSFIHCLAVLFGLFLFACLFCLQNLTKIQFITEQGEPMLSKSQRKCPVFLFKLPFKVMLKLRSCAQTTGLHLHHQSPQKFIKLTHDQLTIV